RKGMIQRELVHSILATTKLTDRWIYGLPLPVLICVNRKGIMQRELVHSIIATTKLTDRWIYGLRYLHSPGVEENNDTERAGTLDYRYYNSQTDGYMDYLSVLSVLIGNE
ncbi:hypothetical protein J6590_100275, partial [Homalodisca vitripennis]